MIPEGGAPPPHPHPRDKPFKHSEPVRLGNCFVQHPPQAEVSLTTEKVQTEPNAAIRLALMPFSFRLFAVRDSQGLQMTTDQAAEAMLSTLR